MDYLNYGINFANRNDYQSDSWQYGRDNSVSQLYSPSFALVSSPDNEGSDLDEIFKDNLRFHKLSTLQILYLIGEREVLCQKNIGSIDSQIAGCHENLSRLNMGRGYFIQPQTILRKIDGLQRILSDLEKQRRNEKVTAWRDTLKLKLSLPNMLKGYQSLKRQESLLQDAT
jgi:hypothetical protein